MKDEYCSEIRQRIAAQGMSWLMGDDAALQHLLECKLCAGVLAALAPDQSEGKPRRSRRWVPRLAGVAMLASLLVGAWTVLAPRHQRSANPTPAADDGDESAPRTRNRFGIEGPPDNADPHMQREAAREQAANAGIIGELKASGSRHRDEALGNDAMSALGALMGDQVGSNFGFGGLGLRGTGRGGAGSATGTIGLGAGYGAFEARMERKDVSHEARSKKPEPQAVQWRSPARSLRAPDLRALPRSASPPPTAANAAAELLARYSSLDGVRFIDPSGYFANTYVPGDPELRALQARLRAYERASLLPEPLRAAKFDDAAERVAQPFDAPGRAALALYLSASERGITAQRRMLLQVGLQATPRYGGRRPAMNIALVLDAREPLDEAANANVRALLAAFAEARDPSDKLTLFAAGPAAGVLVTADAFRLGPLTVALQRVQSERTGKTINLPEALQSALQQLRGHDEPDAPLGSSVAILIAPRAFGAELTQLEALAHASAVDGVPVSAFGAGRGADPEQLARLALAGQGNRRLLEVAGDAAPAVDRELSAVARVVARAVRLRIRLAPGVRLVRVLGSHPLDEVHAQRVRDAENSIDQRTRQSLGIAQDRGEDEEGVQIVIPSFYAGDSHVLLFDVVAEGPGLIADASVRYKDLIQLGNAVARESLWLPKLELARGALQRNVHKNLIAFELANRLRGAGDALAHSMDNAPARRELDGALALLDSIGTAVPELRGDRELEADRSLTAEYLALLGQVANADQRKFAADSLHLASLLKLQPRPEWDASRTGGTAVR